MNEMMEKWDAEQLLKWSQVLKIVKRGAITKVWTNFAHYAE